MTPCMRGFAVLTTVLALGGCAIAHPTAPVAATSRLSTQSLRAPTEVLIKFRTRPDQQAVEAFGSEYGLRPKDLIATIDVYVMTILTGEEATVIVTRLQRSPLVEYAEPNHRLTIQ